jgi:hypothetical protein
MTKSSRTAEHKTTHKPSQASCFLVNLKQVKSIYLFKSSSFDAGAGVLEPFAPGTSVFVLSFDAQPPIIYYKYYN